MRPTDVLAMVMCDGLLEALWRHPERIPEFVREVQAADAATDPDILAAVERGDPADLDVAISTVRRAAERLRPTIH